MNYHRWCGEVVTLISPMSTTEAQRIEETYPWLHSTRQSWGPRSSLPHVASSLCPAGPPGEVVAFPSADTSAEMKCQPLGTPSKIFSLGWTIPTTFVINHFMWG